MIISHKYKYIFIKTQKVSGTSMEIALSHNLGKKDIFSPINLEDEIIRYKMTKKIPSLYLNNKKKDLFYKNLIKKLTKKKFTKKELDTLERKLDNLKFSGNKFFNTMSAKSIKKAVKKDVWDNYFKFTIERNPYDKVISFMFFANRHKKIKSLKKEIDITIKKKKYLNFSQYTAKKKIMVNFIINYQNLNKDIEFVEKNLNIPIRKYYIKTKNYTRIKNTHFNNLLTQSQKKKIYKDAKLEFDIMNYKK